MTHTESHYKYKTDCPLCGGTDTYGIWDDGHGFCFKCKEYEHNASTGHRKTSKVVQATTMAVTTMEIEPYRGISKKTALKYGVLTDPSNGSRMYPYFNRVDGDDMVGAKYKRDEPKDFWFKGDIKTAGLFGHQVFPAGGDTIIITEGEDDALSVYEMLSVPAVSLKSGATSVKSAIKENYDYLTSFKRIVICFDNDEPGWAAREEAARMLPIKQVKLMDFGKGCKYKDANDFLQDGQMGMLAEFAQLYKEARGPQPRGIILGRDAWETAIDKPVPEAVAHYPWSNVDNALRGIRAGEFIMITAETGIGKSYVLNEILWQVYQDNKDRIGCIGQEEDDSDFGKRLMSLYFSLPCHFDDVRERITDAEWAKAKSDIDLDRFVGHYDVADLDVDSILDTVNYMAEVEECKFIFYDHISMAVSSHKQDDERKALDILSTKLKAMAKKGGYTVCVVSHVNRDGTVKGSSNPEKMADVWLELKRDKLNGNSHERNLTEVMVQKARHAGTTGPCGQLFFDPLTFRIKEYVG